jgi:hypothetical protein
VEGLEVMVVDFDFVIGFFGAFEWKFEIYFQYQYLVGIFVQ